MVAFICFFIGVATALPQYGGGGGNSNQNQPQQRPTCMTSYQTVTEVVYDEVIENVCQDTTREQCDWVKQQQCSPQRQQRCRNTQRQKCDSGTKQECNNIWVEENQPYTDQECWTEPCGKIWRTSGYGQKDWVDDPNCNNQRQCKQVTKYKKQRVAKQQCKQVPWQNCYNVPEQQCDWVMENQCQTVPQKQCRQVPHRACQDVHKQVPRNKTRKIPINSCHSNGQPKPEVRPRTENEWENGDNVREFDLSKIRSRANIDTGLTTGGAITFE